MQLTRRGFQTGAGAAMTGGTQLAATEMSKLTGAAGRREFLKGAAMIGAAMAAKCGMAMQPGEQKAWDKYNAMKIPRPEGLLEGEPVLQVPAPDSMGVAFAVTALANGFAELADNPGMEKSVRFMAEGMPLAGIDDRVLRVRMTGLRPGTRYWYRVGAAKLEHPVGYWTKPSETVWGSVHSFVTPGVRAPSHFAMMCDTHAAFAQMARITKLYRKIGVPLVVWNGDVPNSLMNTKDDLVRNYLVPPENDGYAADTPIVLNRGNHDFRGVAANRLGEDAGGGEVFDLGALGPVLRVGDGVEEEQLVDAALVDAVDRGAGEHAVGRAGEDLLRAADLDDRLGRAAEGAGGVHDIVEQYAGLALDAADDVHDLGLVGLFAALVDDGHVHAQLHREGTGAGGAADVGGYDHDVLVALAEALDEVL